MNSYRKLGENLLVLFISRQTKFKYEVLQVFGCSPISFTCDRQTYNFTARYIKNNTDYFYTYPHRVPREQKITQQSKLQKESNISYSEVIMIESKKERGTLCSLCLT